MMTTTSPMRPGTDGEPCAPSEPYPPNEAEPCATENTPPKPPRERISETPIQLKRMMRAHLDRPVWDAREIRKIERLVDLCYDHPETDAICAKLERLVKQWKRIANTPDLPTTAELAAGIERSQENVRLWAASGR